MKELDEGDFDVDSYEAEFLENVMVQNYDLTFPQIGFIEEMKEKYL